MPPRILIVAYGNPLRSDDGIAWRAADALCDKFPASEVEVMRFHQLAPELAENICHFTTVIFLDAQTASDQCAPGQIRSQEITAVNAACAEASRFTHAVSPQMIVTLAATLYRSNPKAFLVTVTGENFDHGESLSAPVAAALRGLVEQVVKIVRSFAEKS
jgi:hydrogenase maturation protease